MAAGNRNGNGNGQRLREELDAKVRAEYPELGWEEREAQARGLAARLVALECAEEETRGLAYPAVRFLDGGFLLPEEMEKAGREFYPGLPAPTREAERALWKSIEGHGFDGEPTEAGALRTELAKRGYSLGKRGSRRFLVLARRQFAVETYEKSDCELSLEASVAYEQGEWDIAYRLRMVQGGMGKVFGAGGGHREGALERVRGIPVELLCDVARATEDAEDFLHYDRVYREVGPHGVRIALGYATAASQPSRAAPRAAQRA